MVNRLYQIIKTDLSGYLVGKIRKYRLVVFSFISTVFSRIVFKIKGVNFGDKLKFYGTPILNRCYGSRIVIESNCSFRSDKSSNLVGVNRKCIISTLREGAKIKIGNNSGFSGTVIGAAESILIGNNVISGANVLITDFDWHPVNSINRHSSVGAKSSPVVIGNNVWLGINTVVLKGVEIGDNTVIGANSLVVNNIPDNVIAAGNPCKVIKPIEFA